MQQHQPRRHLPDFSDAENEMILRQVHAMRRRFLIASRGVGSNSMKRALWQEIAQHINANSTCPRTLTQVKQRHRAMRFEYKKYLTVANSTSNGQMTQKWKPFMDILAEIQTSSNDDDDSGSLNGGDTEMDINEDVDKDSSPSTSLNPLELLANSTVNLDVKSFENVLENDKHSNNHDNSTNFDQFLIQNQERPTEEIIQVHSTRQNQLEFQNPRKRKVNDSAEDLSHEIQLKQLAVLEQQHRNLKLEEQLLQARLNHFARKSRIMNEALLKTFEDDI
ncbi:hypothetical protein M3Y97_00457400 [Aphelenchoides bicaudatus]|nr:hypothetical protein M3Y97_00457400 [Aphelenchoides bicaudatus]